MVDQWQRLRCEDLYKVFILTQNHANKVLQLFSGQNILKNLLKNLF